MKVSRVLGAMGAVGLLASAANAAITLTPVRVAHSVEGETYDVVYLYAHNDGLGPQGGDTHLLALDLKISTETAEQLLVGNMRNGSNGPSGTFANRRWWGDPLGTQSNVLNEIEVGDDFVEFRDGYSWIGNGGVNSFGALPSGTPIEPDPDGISVTTGYTQLISENATSGTPWGGAARTATPNTNTQVLGAALLAANGTALSSGGSDGTSIRVVGLFGGDDGLESNPVFTGNPLGALIAAAVLLDGETVTFSGDIGGSFPNSPKTSFNIVNTPEPASLSLLGLGALGLLRRRRNA